MAAFLSFGLLCACASEKLAVAPPAGVDFSGSWRLNEAESDDPMRLASNPLLDPSRVNEQVQGQGPSQGGGRGRGAGGPGRGGFGGGMRGPAMPGVSALGEGLRWPGKVVEIKQVGGVVTLSSGGLDEVYEPRSTTSKQHRRKTHKDVGSGDLGDRDMPDRDRGQGMPARCGWDDKTLVVQGGEPDDDHAPYEERYSISEDRQRLVEVVSFTGGRSGGFTMSRTWDRVTPSL